jgi:hypothetical protein
VASCRECGVEHRPGELFVAHGDDPLHPLVETCELERAMREAHAAPLPVGSVAYHATDADVLDDVLTSGLDPAATFGTCQHICFAPTPEIAAGTMEIVRRPSLPPGVVFRVLEVDVSGLDLFFELGEARHHGERLEPDRAIRSLDPAPAASIEGWSDPARRRQHSDCLVLHGYPTDRRALRGARDEADRRYGYEHTIEQHRSVALELATRRRGT